MELQVVVEWAVTLDLLDVEAGARWTPPSHDRVSTTSWIPDDLSLRIGRA